MSARGLASGLVQPIARGLVRSATGGGAPWSPFGSLAWFGAFDQSSGSEPNLGGAGEFVAFNSPGYEATGGPGGIPCRTSAGTMQYFALTGISNFSAQPFTIVVWVRWPSIASNTSRYVYASNAYEFCVGQDDNSVGQAYTNADGYRTFASATGNWHCHIARYDPAIKRYELLIDNVSALTRDCPTALGAITAMYSFTDGSLTSTECKQCLFAGTREWLSDEDCAWVSAAPRSHADWAARRT